jgi:hypothetical protein
MVDMQTRFMPSVFRPIFATVSIVILILISQNANAQKVGDYDSSFYATYPNMLTARIYGSHKYTSLRLKAPDSSPKFAYRPNTSMNLGIGATYGILTINLGVGIYKNEEKGKTRSLDLQTRIYARKWIVDLYGQFYKGYYLADHLAANNDNDYYKRRDIKTNLLGLAAYRILNADRFSYRAVFLQNEWQKRSAGSFLLGGEAYYGMTKGDSALVPAALNSLYTQRGIDKFRLLNIGPGAGYAYTLVLKRHFYILGSATANAALSFIKEYDNDVSSDKVSISPNLLFRAAAGYNSDTWSANASWISGNVAANGSGNRDHYLMVTDHFRVTFAKRFAMRGLKGLRSKNEKSLQ